MATVSLSPLRRAEEDAFIARLQQAFTASAVAAGFHQGPEPVISRGEVLESVRARGAESWNVRIGDRLVGGAVVSAPTADRRRSLDLLFVDTDAQDGGIGTAICRAIEQRYPDAGVWETVTPYFDTRNIHFYVNKCGFSIVEFLHPGHPDPHHPPPEETNQEGDDHTPDLMFRFEKWMSSGPARPQLASDHGSSADVVELVALRPSDAGELLTLQRAAYLSEARSHHDFDLPPLLETLAEVEAQLGDPAVIALGLRLGGRLVGSVRVRPRGATAELGRLVVAPDLQGRGLGTRLLQAAEAALPESVQRIELFTGEHSAANMRLYQRHGYVEFARRSTGRYDLVFLARDRERTAP